MKEKELESVSLMDLSMFKVECDEFVSAKRFELEPLEYRENDLLTA